MVGLMRIIIISEEKRRQTDGRSDRNIPFRPDHEHSLLSDLNNLHHPEYPMVRRLHGLAELRGVIAGLSATLNTAS
ncbi:MAG: hypothetical protein ABJO27_19505 [Pseudoruegeria sp.]